MQVKSQYKNKVNSIFFFNVEINQEQNKPQKKFKHVLLDP
jgi:hypothetical protein